MIIFFSFGALKDNMLFSERLRLMEVKCDLLNAAGDAQYRTRESFLAFLKDSMEVVRVELPTNTENNELLTNITDRFELYDRSLRDQHASNKDMREMIQSLISLCKELVSKVTLQKQELDKLAVRQFVNCVRQKIFLEIAGDNADEFAQLHISGYKQLSADKGILTNRFRERWIKVQSALNIRENEEVLGRMDKVVKNLGNLVAHENFTQTIDELFAIAKDLPHAASTIPLLTYGKALAEKRKGEGLFEVKKGSFII